MTMVDTAEMYADGGQGQWILAVLRPVGDQPQDPVGPARARRPVTTLVAQQVVVDQARVAAERHTLGTAQLVGQQVKLPLAHQVQARDAFERLS